MRRLDVFLVLAFVGCGGASSPSAQSLPSTTVNTDSAPPGMSKYPYLAADGGPHILLPAEAAGAWTGAPSIGAVVNPNSDYGRACAATTNAQWALIPVGSTCAIVFADPPMTAWGQSADGLTEVYYLKSWNAMNLDALIARATAALATASLTESGKSLQFREPDAFLLFAGDSPKSAAYGVHRVTVPAGNYKILVGTYSAAGESVTVYRLKPAGP